MTIPIICNMGAAILKPPATAYKSQWPNTAHQVVLQISKLRWQFGGA